VPSGSIYTYTANADPKNGTSAIQTSQGVVRMGQYGYFTAAEVAEAANLGYVLQAGIVASAAPGQTIAPTTPALLNLSGVTPSSLVAVDANNNITSGPLVASVQGVASAFAANEIPADVRLEAAATGQVPVKNADGGWAPATPSGGSAAVLTPTAVQTSGTYAASPGDLVLVDLSTANVTIQLPSAGSGVQVGYKVIGYNAAYALMVQLQGSDSFDRLNGATVQIPVVVLDSSRTYQREQGTSIWIGIDGDTPISQLDARYVTASQIAGTTNNVMQFGPMGVISMTGSYGLTAGGTQKVGDGSGTTLASVFANITAAKAVYPFATSTTQTVDFCALQLTVNSVSANGGGRVYMPTGNYMTSTSITPASLVSMTGDGPTTVLTPTGKWTGIYLLSTASSPLTDCTFADFAVNGVNQTGGTYNVAVKGLSIPYSLRCNSTRLHVYSTHATGIAMDEMRDGSITDCIAYGCGTGWTTGSLGGAGIGIGNSATGAEQTCTIHGNHSDNNGSYGIFFENQVPGNAGGNSPTALLGNTCLGNGKAGIGVGGGAAMTVTGNVTDGNGTSGTGLNTANIEIATGTNGYGGGAYMLVENNACINSLGHGIIVSGSTGITNPRRLRISGNLVYGNGGPTQGQDGYGIFLNGANFVLADIAVNDNTVCLNKSHGLIVSGGTSGGVVTYTHTNLALRDNDCYGNGQAGGQPSGIDIANCTITGLDLLGNKCYLASNHQSYGINIESTATVTGGQIKNNNVANNATAGMVLAGTLIGVEVGNNPGFNPVGKQTVALVSGTSVTSPYARMFYLTGASDGTSTVTISAVGTSLTIPLPANALVPVRVPAAQSLTPAGTAPACLVYAE
jgi:hypothetical protein